MNHQHLKAFLMERIADGYILKLITEWLRAGVVYLDTVTYPEMGTPQGGVISPLLAISREPPHDANFPIEGHHWLHYRQIETVGKDYGLFIDRFHRAKEVFAQLEKIHLVKSLPVLEARDRARCRYRFWPLQPPNIVLKDGIWSGLWRARQTLHCEDPCRCDSSPVLDSADRYHRLADTARARPSICQTAHIVRRVSCSHGLDHIG